MHQLRIDKFLWSVRLFKTRMKASEACDKGRVFINGNSVKPSKEIRVGDIFDVKRNPVTYSFCVVAMPQGRVGAKLVEQYIEDITSPEQLTLLEMLQINKNNQRAKGLGRPTKKERRSIEAFFEGGDSLFDDYDE